MAGFALFVGGIALALIVDRVTLARADRSAAVRPHGRDVKADGPADGGSWIVGIDADHELVDGAEFDIIEQNGGSAQLRAYYDCSADVAIDGRDDAEDFNCFGAGRHWAWTGANTQASLPEARVTSVVVTLTRNSRKLLGSADVLELQPVFGSRQRRMSAIELDASLTPRLTP